MLYCESLECLYYKGISTVIKYLGRKSKELQFSYAKIKTGIPCMQCGNQILSRHNRD